MNLLFITSVSLYLDFVGHSADYCEADNEDNEDKTSGQKNVTINKRNAVKQATNQSYYIWPEKKCNLLKLDFNANAFDDQYKGCSDILETDVMPKVLTLEKSINLAFGSAWNRAEVQWNKVKTTVRLPIDFRDEFGIAITVYTTDWPEDSPIYKVFNGNVSLAGRSRDHYMKNFHYKALHFYLTRALQVLKKKSKKRYKTYRGTDSSFQVSETVLRFGRFTSSSVNIEVAKEYHEGLLFEITTCFGVDIHKISSFPKEQEVLIPVTEKFHYVEKEGNVITVNSTCELCSYFNCAYLGEEKHNVAVCSSVV